MSTFSNYRVLPATVLAVFFLAWPPCWTFADNPSPTLSATGLYTTKLRAQRVRIAIPLVAQTLSVAESLEAIRDRKLNARQRTLELLCVEDSLTFSGTSVDDGASGDEYSTSSIRMMNAMGNQIDVDELPTLATARTTMTADWLLPPGADMEAVLGIVEEIVANLKEPDVTGKNDRPEFTPRVEEALKTLQAQTRSYSGMNRMDMNSIRYAFVATIEPEAQREAMRKAYEDARSQVADLASAADLTVGSLLSMNNSSSTRYAGPSMTRSYNGFQQTEVLQARDNEVLAFNLSELEHSVRISASFGVKNVNK